MSREDVARNQRSRIHGALIESVARHGYSNTSVRHIIAYAGVSRHVFYEFFLNKEDCFLATFDFIAQRLALLIARACNSVEDPQKRRQLAMHVLVDELEANPKSMRLLLVDALTVSPGANRHLRRLLSAAERSLESPAAPWIIGGLYRVLFGRLRTERLESTLEEHILDWAQPLISKEFHSLRAGQGRAPPPWPQTPQLPLTAQDDRARLEESAINMMLRYDEVSPLTISVQASVPLDTYLRIFKDVNECVQAALETQAQQLLEVISDRQLVSDTWPTAVRHAIGRATAYLVANPAYTTMLATKVYELGLPITERTLLLGDEIATLLTQGAPNPQTRLTIELISGALARTLTTEVQAKRGHRLQDLDIALSTMVLASCNSTSK